MKYALSILSIFIFSSVFSQDMHNDSSANYIANWTKGENRIFDIIHNKESYDSGKLTSEFNFSYEAHIMVLDSTKNDYTIQWTFNLPDKVKETNPELADSLPVFNGMKMIFKTSGTGEFIELINWEEVRDSYFKMMEISLPKEMDSSANAAIAKSKALFKSQETVESAFIKEIKLFYQPYGYTYTTNEINATAQLPNPFGGEPLPALVTSKITELNPKQNYFTLVIRQDINKLNAQKFFEGFLKKANIDSAKAVIEAMKIMETFEIKDYNEFKFIPSIGWPKRIKYQRTLKTGQITKTDSFIIEMKE